MEITNNYSSYAMQNATGNGTANSTKKKEREKAAETAGNSKSKSTAEYVSELAKLVPSVELEVGNGFSSAKNGKTLTINPQLLEKMQKDPEQEKETKELIKGVEDMTRLIDSMNKASGWTTVFRHSYIDENGKYRQIAFVRNDYMLNMSDKLREERRENSEKLIEKTKEKAAKEKEELQEQLGERRTEKEHENEKTGKAEQLIREKMTASKEGMVYLYDTDIREIMEVMKEEHADKTDTKEQMQVGANIDLQV